MLLQQMTSPSLGYETEREKEYKSDLQESIDSFEQTLTAMRQGGKIIDNTGYELVIVLVSCTRLDGASRCVSCWN